jgi:hypothetical protein
MGTYDDAMIHLLLPQLEAKAQHLRSPLSGQVWHVDVSQQVQNDLCALHIDQSLVGSLQSAEILDQT